MDEAEENIADNDFRSSTEIALESEVQAWLDKVNNPQIDTEKGQLKRLLSEFRFSKLLINIGSVALIFSVMYAGRNFFLAILIILLRFVGISSDIFSTAIGPLLFCYPIGLGVMYGYLRHWVGSFIHVSRIEAREDGLRFKWPSQFEMTLRWDQISSVFLLRPADSMVPQHWLVGFGAGLERPVMIRMPVTSVIGPQLIEELQKHCKWASIDPVLLESWQPRIADSKTELWMKSLSNAPKESQLMPLFPGDSVKDKRYMITSRIGVGGQGTAYRAQDIDTDSEVVLKETLFPVYVDPEVREKAEKRFYQEVELLTHLNCDSVVKMRDSFVDNHRGYLVLDFIDGLSLRQLVRKEGVLEEKLVIRYALQMAEMLKYLQDLQPVVVHRDFTPDNLILNKQGQLILIDFSVARQLENTKTATVVGKHAYIPPEQFRGDADGRSDIYAFGCTLFYLLIGEDPEPISQSFLSEYKQGLSKKLNDIVAKATEQSAADRFQTPNEIIQALTDL